MIRPERDPHWCLGVEHGRDAVKLYTFQDAENQRRYVLGYLRGELLRRMLLEAQPLRQLPDRGERWLVYNGKNTTDAPLRPGAVWKL